MVDEKAGVATSDKRGCASRSPPTRLISSSDTVDDAPSLLSTLLPCFPCHSQPQPRMPRLRTAVLIVLSKTLTCV